MNASLFDRARAERFAQLMDEANGARRHHAHSHLDEELGELVTVGRRVRAMRMNGHPTESFKRDLRAQLMATARNEGIGITAQCPPRRGISFGAHPRARGAIVIGVAAGTLALSGVSMASSDANPGDTLYAMKRHTEKAQLALAGSDVSRGQLYLEFARTRLNEAQAVWSYDEHGFVNSLHDMDLDTQQGIRLLIAAAVNQHDTMALDAIDRFVSGQRPAVHRMLGTSGDTGRAQVTESLQLLTAIQNRSDSARAAMACGASQTGYDLLGPILGGCGAPKSQSSPMGTGRNPSEPEQQPAAPLGSPTVSQSASPTASAAPAPEQTNGGLLGELGRILGGLLGG